MTCVIIAGGAMCGCAAYNAYRKCRPDGCPGDAKITAEVRTQLNRHPALAPPNQVYAQTLDGVVYLTGQVATDTGVSRVVNTIALTYSGR
ncbi:MAG: BON domain-containing protein [Gammaproteobacteria bacterium]|nr:MAG: BON domain-containing protein [Gammaproteobacteria bacterium]